MLKYVHVNNTIPSKKDIRSHLLGKYVIVPITNVCNLSCGGCSQFCGLFPKNKLWFIDLDLLEKNIRICKKYMYEKGFIGIFGGEPTLHPKFNEILDILRKDLSINFSVYTNGRRPVKDEKNIKYVISDKNNENVIDSIFHFPTLVSPKDILKIQDNNFYWELAKNNCSLWNNCGVTIYRDKAYYCEIAGSMDWLFNDGENGWEINEALNPFDKNEEDVMKQASKFCHRCGWCLSSSHEGMRTQKKMPYNIPQQNLKDPYLITNSNFIDIGNLSNKTRLIK